MRILHLIQEMRTGGAERVVVALAEGATAAGHQVAVASAGGELLWELDVPNFPLPRLRRRVSAVPGAAIAASRAIRSWSPTVVHCHNPGMAAITSLATLRGRRVPAAVSVHGVPEADWEPAARVLRLAGLPVVACGPGVAEALAHHGITVRQTILNGVAVAPAASSTPLTTAFDTPIKAPVVMSIGRLVGQKNHALAIRAIARIPEASLVILGEGPDRPELEELVREQGVASRVLLPGVRQDARALMGAADAILFTSHWEGLSLAALEALSSGRPVVSVAARGLTELLTDGENALLVDLDDPELVAAAIRRVLADEALATRLGEAGRSLAAQYSEEEMVSRFLQLYGDLTT
jgi:glycosyltransferase involved in cell wall biosynthesis